jgi:exopolysaccharide biosynthesis polyprenyl glycosylphosphotransferase
MLAVLLVATGTDPDPGMRVAAPLVVGFSLAALGLYRPRLALSVLDDLPRLLAGVAVAVAAGLTFSTPPDGLPVGAVLRTLLAASAVVLLPRAVAYPLLRRLRCWRPGAPTLIVGSAQLGRELGRIFISHPEYGLWPVGYLDGAPAGRRQDDLPAPLLGDHRDLATVIERLDVRRVVVAFGAIRRPALVDMLHTCARMSCEVFVVPRLFEFQQRGRDVDHVRGIPLLRLRRAALQRPTWRLKRLLDVTVAAVALAAATPVLAVCAAAVRVEGGPGVLFRQERVGLGGRRFEIIKLRSMRPSSAAESQTHWSVCGDRRVGPVGRLLRATSLDELPQLVNVLRGEMSLVGPRPERPFFVEQFGRDYPRYTDRHRVPVGLTGWAAVNGLRGDTSIADRVRYDNHYIENWSLWFDVKIIVRTIGAVLTRAGG